MWWSDGKITTILFPGFSPTRPYRTRERRTWLGLVMCLPESGRLQMNDFGGGTDKCEIRLAVKHTVHWHFQEKFNILGFSLQYGSIINEHKLLSPFQCGFRSNHSTEFVAAAFSDFIRVVWIKVYLLVLCLLTCAKRLILSITIYWIVWTQEQWTELVQKLFI